MELKELLSDPKWLGITAILAVLIFIQGLINRFTNSGGGFIFVFVVLAHIFSFRIFGWIGVITHVIATIIFIAIINTLLDERR